MSTTSSSPEFALGLTPQQPDTAPAAASEAEPDDSRQPAAEAARELTGSDARLALTSGPVGVGANPGVGASLPARAETPHSAAAAAIASAPPAPQCANCGAPVPGKFCGACGQRLDHSVHSVSHFVREATEDLTHADSRLWRTLLALLFKPGLLTREFLDGKRASYLPPLRLYLVVSVVFFLLAGAQHREHAGVVLSTDEHKLPSIAVKPLSELDAPSGTATRPGSSTQPGASTRPAAGTPAQGARTIITPLTETPAERAERICSKVQIDEDTLDPKWTRRLQRSCRRTLEDNGATVSETFVHNIPRAMFVFLPLLAWSMKLLYWKPRRYYVEHLLFCIHNHAFIFVLFGLYFLAAALIPAGALTTTLFEIAQLYTFYYIYRSMRRVYGQSRVRTLAKFLVLTCFYIISGGILGMIVYGYSAYGYSAPAS